MAKQHLHYEIERLKKRILSVSAIVDESLTQAMDSLVQRDQAMAQSVIDADKQIDLLEVEVEEECLKILALHQPVAIDLRYIISVLKINNDLERIGDLASNLAERSISLADKKQVEIPAPILQMAEKSQTMLKQSIDSLVDLDYKLAVEVCQADDEVDNLYSQMYSLMEEHITSEPEKLDTCIQFLTVSRYLERIADHATNIAEDVMYMIDGQISRHQT